MSRRPKDVVYAELVSVAERFSGAASRVANELRADRSLEDRYRALADALRLQVAVSALMNEYYRPEAQPTQTPEPGA